MYNRDATDLCSAPSQKPASTLHCCGEMDYSNHTRVKQNINTELSIYTTHGLPILKELDHNKICLIQYFFGESEGTSRTLLALATRSSLQTIIHTGQVWGIINKEIWSIELRKTGLCCFQTFILGCCPFNFDFLLSLGKLIAHNYLLIQTTIKVIPQQDFSRLPFKDSYWHLGSSLTTSCIQYFFY